MRKEHSLFSTKKSLHTSFKILQYTIPNLDVEVCAKRICNILDSRGLPVVHGGPLIVTTTSESYVKERQEQCKEDFTSERLMWVAMI